MSRQHRKASTGPKLQSWIEDDGGLCRWASMGFDQQGRCFSLRSREVAVAGRVVEAIGSFTIRGGKFDELRFADVSIIYLWSQAKI